MASHDEALAKTLVHTARMMKTLLAEGSVPLIVIAARPEDESTVLVAYPGASKQTIVEILEETLEKVRLQPGKQEYN